MERNGGENSAAPWGDDADVDPKVAMVRYLVRAAFREALCGYGEEAMIEIIRSQSGPDEMRYLHLTQHHDPLRRELLRLGFASRSLNENLPRRR